MVASHSIHSYDDCFRIMQAAIEDELGARIACIDEGEATWLRLRYNKARAVHRKQNAQVYASPEHPLHGRSEYDGLIFRVKEVEGKWYVYLEVGAGRAEGFELLSQLPEEAANDDGSEPEQPA